MATYNFDPQASTNGAGTEGDPLNALPTNFSSAGYVDDDVFLIKRGSSYAPSWAGTDATLHTVNRRLRFGAYGSGPKPIITPMFTGTGSGRLFRVFTSGCVFEDIEFRDGSRVDPLYVQGSIAGFTVQRCDFSNIRGGIGQNAINVGASTPLTGALRVMYCTFDTIANDAMVLNCSGTIEVGHNTVVRPSVDSENGDCVAAVGDCTLLWVHDNDLTHDENDFKHGIIQDAGTTGFALIERNRIKCSNKPGIYMTLPALIRSNHIDTHRSGIYCNGVNIKVQSNVILQKAGGTDTGAVWGASAGMEVVGNTIIRDATTTELSNAAIRNNTSDASNVYKNNLIVGFERGIRKGADALESNNAFWQVTTPVVDASQVTVVPTDESTADPDLAGYRPRPGSPLLTGGADLGPVRDIEGKQGRSYIGAYCAARLAGSA